MSSPALLPNDLSAGASTDPILSSFRNKGLAGAYAAVTTMHPEDVRLAHSEFVSALRPHVSRCKLRKFLDRQNLERATATLLASDRNALLKRTELRELEVACDIQEVKRLELMRHSKLQSSKRQLEDQTLPTPKKLASPMSMDGNDAEDWEGSAHLTYLPSA